MKSFAILLRILVGLVFIISAIVKLYPTEVLEVAIVETGLIGWTLAPFAARLLIGFELLLGVFLILGFYRKLFIPAGIWTLLIFSLYLVFLLLTGSNEENCNCFGIQYEMTPLQSILKNIVLVAILILAGKVGSREKNIPYKRLISLLTALVVFALPFLLSFVIVADKSWQNHPVDKALNLDALYENDTLAPPQENLHEGKWIIAIVSNSCPHCQVAGYKLSVMHKQIDELRLYLLIGGSQESADAFHFTTKTSEIPYSVVKLEQITALLSSGRIRFPSIFLVEEGVIRYNPTTHGFTEKDIINWLEGRMPDDS